MGFEVTKRYFLRKMPQRQQKVKLNFLIPDSNLLTLFSGHRLRPGLFAYAPAGRRSYP